MAKILITSGPTRQYLDPVRFISNASSGRMGSCLVDAALAAGHEVVLVTGPVEVDYAKSIKRVDVLTTEEMLNACLSEFTSCNGMIGAAAPCDYQPIQVADHKLKKSGEPLSINLVETVDIVATLGQKKRLDQWTVGFALETEDARFRAISKLQKKHCDLVVSNGATAINSNSNTVEILDECGNVAWAGEGAKSLIAENILRVIGDRLVKA
jgi:phosphopantothenoylcysteine decarboxylase/phosphopantothenate--cysteine ligase